MISVSKTFATIAGCVVLAAASSAPVAAFSHKQHNKKHHRGHYYSGHDLAHHAHLYAPRHQYGHRPNCAMLKQRARLTGNAYWHYAAHSCWHDYYRKAY